MKDLTVSMDLIHIYLYPVMSAIVRQIWEQERKKFNSKTKIFVLFLKIEKGVKSRRNYFEILLTQKRHSLTQNGFFVLN